MDFPLDLVAELRRFSARWGADPSLVQGAGGNSSRKIGDRMMVKASGKRLEDAERDEIFVTVGLGDLKPVVAGGLRASIETALHSLMPHAVVVHVHMVDALAYAVRADGEWALATRLAGLHWGWVPYAKPGDDLAAAVAALAGAGAGAGGMPDIVVLANHGIVIGGDSCAEVDARIEEIRGRLKAPVRGMVADGSRLAEVAERMRLVPASIAEAHLAADRANLAFATKGSLYPDHVVFLGRGATVIEMTNDGPVIPADAGSILFLVEGVGAFVPANAPLEAHEMAGCLGAVAARIEAGATVAVLSAAEEDELLRWEAEAYRKSLATADEAKTS